ncbi:MAG: glycoside hydrolase family 16 [Bacteroidetes bacterium]|uniref:glycoside hydrolase n=1 Tax=[Flexibacter] sp. ATCC 35208 TaxID=1936242 RepID=UPI0009CC974B|nr:glycoside hydrolase [[Flexibacter] sp. ATCC 35208]MBP1650814.1 glycoside hydrolase family 16 [Bacteroidota bacterium]OMP75611.1 glycoside hydrolase [[Flexibacter] sp. ATCC 35208]
MKIITVVLLALSIPFLTSCGKQWQEKVPAAVSAKTIAAAEAAETWETVLDGNSFADYTAFEAAWNYLYPWGSDHNGTARMYGSSTDHNHIYLNNGVLTIKAAKITWDEGTSSSSPYLAIHYHSGAVNTKEHVLVNDQFPNWEVKCDFQVPTVTGSWPAFWLTGVNSWPPESDIMEFKGSATNWQNTFRTSSDVSSTLTTVSSPGSWHTYRAWITKVSDTNVDIHYYIDGVWKAVHNANFVGKPLYVIINMQMEGSSGTPGPTADTYLYAKNIYIGRTRTY